MEPWMQKLNKEIGDIVGEEQLSHYRIIVLPQILADFYKMLKDQPVNKIIKEQYRMENGKLEIEISGVKKADADIKVLDANVKRLR